MAHTAYRPRGRRSCCASLRLRCVSPTLPGLCHQQHRHAILRRIQPLARLVGGRRLADRRRKAVGFSTWFGSAFLSSVTRHTPHTRLWFRCVKPCHASKSQVACDQAPSISAQAAAFRSWKLHSRRLASSSVCAFLSTGQYAVPQGTVWQRALGSVFPANCNSKAGARAECTPLGFHTTTWAQCCDGVAVTPLASRRLWARAIQWARIWKCDCICTRTFCVVYSYCSSRVPPSASRGDTAPRSIRRLQPGTPPQNITRCDRPEVPTGNSTPF